MVEGGSSGRRKPWMIRAAVAATVLVLGAIVAGLLVNRTDSTKARRRPDTVVQSTEGGPAAVEVKSKPLLDPAYAYQMEGKVQDPSASPLPLPSDKQQQQQATMPRPPTAAAGGPGGSGGPIPTDAGFLGRLTAEGWQAVGGGAPSICYPINGTELVKASTADSPCTVIVLTRTYMNPYNVRQTMNISTTKVFVGNPIDPPRIIPKGVDRMFTVEEGGNLDIRSVAVTRAPGRTIPGVNGYGDLRIIMGGSVLIQPGGNFHGRGVLFELSNQTVNSTINDITVAMQGQRNRNFGGHIMQLGGVLRLEGCFFITFRPLGNPVINSLNIGRDILVVYGRATLLGCWIVTVQAYTSAVAVGNSLANLAGFVYWIGGGIATANGLQAQYGAGMQIFVGGGVLVDVGFGYATTNANVFRAGFGQFSVAAGVHIRVGYQQARAWGVACINNFGQTFATGVGIQHVINSVVASTTNCVIFNGNGGTTALSQGDMMWTGVASARSAVAQAQYGLGLVWSNGNGNIRLIQSPEATSQVVRIQACLGTVTYLGSGLTMWINMTRYTTQLANAFIGAGNQVYVGSGAAIAVLSKTYSKVGNSFRTSNSPKAAVTVGFSQYSTAQAYGNQDKVTFMTHGKIFTLRQRRRQRLLQDALPSPSPSANASSSVNGSSALSPNFVAIIGEERREWHLSSTTNTSHHRHTITEETIAETETKEAPAAMARSPGRFNGLGDLFEHSGFKFKSWADVGRAQSEALSGIAIKGLQWVEEEGATVQSNNQIKVKNTSPRHCLVANLHPQAEGKGSAGHLEMSKELAGGRDVCRALDYDSQASSGASSFSALGVYEEAVGHIPQGEAFDDPVEGQQSQSQQQEPSNLAPDSQGPAPVTSYLLQARISVACTGTGSEGKGKQGKEVCVDANVLKWVLLDVLDLPTTAALSVSTPLHDVPSSLTDTIASHTGVDLREHMAQSMEGESVVMRDSGGGRRGRRRLSQACEGSSSSSSVGGGGVLMSAYEVRGVAQSEEVGERIREGLKAMEEEGADSLLMMLQDVLDEHRLDMATSKEGEGVLLCGASVRVTADVSVPSDPQPWRPSASSSLAPSLSLGDGRSPLPPSTLSLSYPRAYSLFVSNFPDGHDLVCKLIRGTDSTGPIVLNIARFRDRGYAEAQWRLEEGVLPKGWAEDDSFYLHLFSKQLPALFATTQPFKIKRGGGK